MFHFSAKLSVPSESGFEGEGLLLTPCNRWELTCSPCSVTLFSQKVVKMLLMGYKLEAVFHKPDEVFIISSCCHFGISFISALRLLVSIVATYV